MAVSHFKDDCATTAFAIASPNIVSMGVSDVATSGSDVSTPTLLLNFLMLLLFFSFGLVPARNRAIALFAITLLALVSAFSV